MRAVLPAMIVAGLVGPLPACVPYQPRVHMIEVSSRVRIGITDSVTLSPLASRSQRVQGTVRGIAPDTLYLDISGARGTVAIPRIQIVGVEMSRGKPSRRASALEIGSNGALLVGLLMSSKYAEPKRRFGSHWNATAAGAGIGFAAGALIGALRPYERWRIAWIPE